MQNFRCGVKFKNVFIALSDFIQSILINRSIHPPCVLFFKLRSSHFQKPSQNVIPRQNSILNIVYCNSIFGVAIKNCARRAKIDVIVSCKDWYELRQMSTYHLRRMCLNVPFTTSSKSSRWSSNSEFACPNNSQIQQYFFKIIQKIQKKKLQNTNYTIPKTHIRITRIYFLFVCLSHEFLSFCLYLVKFKYQN